MHIKERIFSGCEYENERANFCVFYLHYVRIAGCILNCCKATKHLTMLLYLCLIRPVSYWWWTKIGLPDFDLQDCQKSYSKLNKCIVGRSKNSSKNSTVHFFGFCCGFPNEYYDLPAFLFPPHFCYWQMRRKF